MERQLFVVTPGVPPVVGQCFYRVDSKRMSSIIRNAVRAKSCSFIAPVPLKITVERMDEAASASGEVRKYREKKET